MTKHFATYIYYDSCPVNSLFLYCTGNIKCPTALGIPVNENFDSVTGLVRAIRSEEYSREG